MSDKKRTIGTVCVFCIVVIATAAFYSTKSGCGRDANGLDFGPTEWLQGYAVAYGFLMFLTLTLPVFQSASLLLLLIWTLFMTVWSIFNLIIVKGYNLECLNKKDEQVVYMEIMSYIGSTLSSFFVKELVYFVIRQ
jgi:hypothetical protein